MSKRVALGALSRLYAVATTPYQLLRDLVNMPVKMLRVIVKAHDDVNSQRDPSTKKINTQDLLKVSKTAALNMAKVLISPLTTLVSLACVTILGLENAGGKNSIKAMHVIKHLKPDLKEPVPQTDLETHKRLMGQDLQLK